MKKIFLAIVIIASLNSCIKTSDDEPVCIGIKNIKAVVTPTSVNSGGSITLSTTNNDLNAYYEWRSANLNAPSFGAKLEISNAKISDRGWYYLRVYTSSCSEDKKDSVYVTVKLPQGSPTCTVTSNTVNYNNMSTDVYSSISKSNNASLSLLSLSGNSSGSSLIVNFHPFWTATNEPEDGIYYTNNIPSFSGDFNQVYITLSKNSIPWVCNASQPVYVSHVNGKLQVKYCNLPMGGYNGTSFSTLASGTILQTN